MWWSKNRLIITKLGTHSYGGPEHGQAFTAPSWIGIMLPCRSVETSRLQFSAFNPNNMNLVQSAMRRPLTVVVAVIAVAFWAGFGAETNAKGYFPTLGIPTI